MRHLLAHLLLLLPFLCLSLAARSDNRQLKYHRGSGRQERLPYPYEGGVAIPDLDEASRARAKLYSDYAGALYLSHRNGLTKEEVEEVLEIGRAHV